MTTIQFTGTGADKLKLKYSPLIYYHEIVFCSSHALAVNVTIGFAFVISSTHIRCEALQYWIVYAPQMHYRVHITKIDSHIKETSMAVFT